LLSINILELMGVIGSVQVGWSSGRVIGFGEYGVLLYGLMRRLRMVWWDREVWGIQEEVGGNKDRAVRVVAVRVRSVRGPWLPLAQFVGRRFLPDRTLCGPNSMPRLSADMEVVALSGIGGNIVWGSVLIYIDIEQRGKGGLFGRDIEKSR
jgi:hypothetical protein